MYTRVSIICQEGKMESYKLASLLLNIRGISITSAAKSCGLNASAVAGWLKGVPGRLSQEKQNILLGYLGISGGTLASDRVHRWKASDDLTTLHELLAWVNSTGSNKIPEIVRLRPQNPDPFSLFNFLSGESMYAITGPFRALIQRKVPPIAPAGSIWKIEDIFWIDTTFRLLKWRDDIEKDSEFGNEPTLRLERTLFDKWFQNGNVSLEEFDSIVHGNEKVAEESEKKKGWRPKSQNMTKIELVKEPLFSSKLQDEPDWALVERITGKKCPETVSLRNLSQMTEAELSETLGLTDDQGRKLGAALILGERLANEAIERINQRLEKEKQDHSKDPGSDSSL